MMSESWRMLTDLEADVLRKSLRTIQDERRQCGLKDHAKDSYLWDDYQDIVYVLNDHSGRMETPIARLQLATFVSNEHNPIKLSF